VIGPSASETAEGKVCCRRAAMGGAEAVGRASEAVVGEGLAPARPARQAGGGARARRAAHHHFCARDSVAEASRLRSGDEGRGRRLLRKRCSLCRRSAAGGGHRGERGGRGNARPLSRARSRPQRSGRAARAQPRRRRALADHGRGGPACTQARPSSRPPRCPSDGRSRRPLPSSPPPVPSARALRPCPPPVPPPVSLPALPAALASSSGASGWAGPRCRRPWGR
jgi:hypothetical protein